MPPIPFHRLSDEPLYCEAVHDRNDDGFHSGSEDDHYEGPLHRRLHIEKKAIDFLSGNVPILISAALRGPFDREQWNNPWRSTRAESHAELCKARPGRSKQTAVCEEDLPDTQGTSLYPLPSPETTNPPSAKKNPYMDEQDYSRVKTWREAVKGTAASKDPFWQSQQDDNDENPRAKKRSADSTWLHKRDGKKPRSAKPRNSNPDDSPSRGAARTRGSQNRQLHSSQMVAQFLRNSSPPEDELATVVHTRSPRSNISPMANKIMGMTPHRAKLYFQAPDSEDELSMPATTPTSRAIRTSTVVSASPKRDSSPSRQRKITKSKSRSSKGRGKSSIGREKAKKSQVAQPSTGQGPDHDGTSAVSRASAQMAKAAVECMDARSQKSFTKQSEPIQNQVLPDNTSTAKSMIVPQTLATLPSTQQDDSFLFHKRARSPTGIQGGRSTGVPKKRVTRSQSSLQLFAVKMNEPEAQSAQGDDPAVPVVPSPTTMTRKKPQEGQCSLVEIERESRDRDVSSAVDEGCLSSHKQLNQQIQSTEGYKMNDETEMMVTVKVEPVATNDSSEALPLRDTNEQRVPEEPQSLPQVDGGSQSESDWSTYLDTENQTPASLLGKETTKPDGILVVEFGVDGSSDPEWSTFVNTQDITPVISYPETTVDLEEVLTDISHRDPDIQVVSDQATLTNVENLPPVSLDVPGMAQKTAQTASVAVCPLDLAGDSGGTSEDSAPVTVSEDPMYTQASVGSIIDAYAEISVLSNSSEPRTTEMPGAECVETEAKVLTQPCSLPNQIATVSADESEEHENICSGKPQQLQTTLQKSDAAEYLSGITCGPTKSDETTFCVEERKVEDLSGLALQTLGVSEETAGFNDGSSSLNEPTACPAALKLQNSLIQEAISSLQMPPQAPSNETRPDSHSGGLDEAAAQIQSPWNKTADMASHLFVPLMACTSPSVSTPDLGVLAGKALAMSQPAQSPWGPPTPAAPSPPAQDFEMSIRAFSDFMSPSPVKKRASSNRNILRSSSAKPGILFKTPAPRKPDRRVHFAPLPGEQETCFTESDTDGKDAIYEEEDISYFDLSGRKTGTVRMPKPTTRAASPPPMEMSAVEVGALPDHDQKFAKHFEAMSKRKKPIRKSLRLLPSRSQQSATASQDAGAMAEAFIQASQTRRKCMELAPEKKAEVECRPEYVDKTSVPVAMDIFEDQENVEPVDDVSLVLDNLDKFLDNTWGIDMGTGESTENDARSKQDKEIAPSQGAPQKLENPMLALETNVWAD